MREAVCDIWAQRYIVITTNGVLDRNNDLVMGAGVALEAKKRYPDLPSILGSVVQARGNVPHVFMTEKQTVISFPTKHHWREESDPELIRCSAEHLVSLADLYCFPEIHIPRPGCANGKLIWKNVKEILEPILDDRFVVCTR